MRKSALWAMSLGAAIAATPLLAQVTETPIAPTQTQGGLVAGKVLDSGVRACFTVPSRAIVNSAAQLPLRALCRV